MWLRCCSTNSNGLQFLYSILLLLLLLFSFFCVCSASRLHCCWFMLCGDASASAATTLPGCNKWYWSNATIYPTVPTLKLGGIIIGVLNWFSIKINYSSICCSPWFTILFALFLSNNVTFPIRLCSSSICGNSRGMGWDSQQRQQQQHT